ncbi:MAG: HlyD family efflux transporter periplasmic adaptor subunit [Syntrophaceae bacterium]|nr:HlyD family efflux transporter periplasmic adaptor subunit [Syntrophaceae bacterium]
MTMKKVIILILVIAIGMMLYLGWMRLRPSDLPEGFSRGNGRIEAVEIDVACKMPGRISAIFVDEGDFVKAGQVLAQMDTDVLKAQLREAEAQFNRAQSAVETAMSTVSQTEFEKAAAQSLLAQRKAELDAAAKRLSRTEKLAEKEVRTAEQLDDHQAAFFGAEAAYNAAKARVEAANAAIITAKSQVVGAEASVDAARATIERIKADIEDSALKSPRGGRVQYRVAQQGEVLGAGGKVLNLIDLSDVYMTFFLPTAAAGRIGMGSEVRLVFDAAPEYVIPASVSFVANVAQFTPKSVETTEERQKLMFRVKAKIDPKLLERYVHYIKTGLPGMAYVRLDPNRRWPENLQTRAPNEQ